jgi:hypothetical protein
MAGHSGSAAGNDAAANAGSAGSPTTKKHTGCSVANARGGISLLFALCALSLVGLRHRRRTRFHS